MCMQNKLLTIVVPVYNAENYIKDCVQTLIDQDYSCCEIILVDDGSTDNSLTIMQSISKADGRIKIFHKANGGQASARNYGLSVAKGTYITFVDADDKIAPDSYSQNIEYMQLHPEVDICQFPCTIKCGTSKEKVLYNADDSFKGTERIYNEWLIKRKISNYVCNKIFRKEVFRDVSFKEGIIYEDRYLMSVILGQISRIDTSSIGMYYYYDRPHQTTKINNSFSLYSKLLADLRIVSSIAGYPSLLDEQIKRFNNCLTYYSQISKDCNYSLKLREKLNTHTPPIWKILFSGVAVGIKIRILLFRFVGRIYL